MSSKLDKYRKGRTSRKTSLRNAVSLACLVVLHVLSLLTGAALAQPLDLHFQSIAKSLGMVTREGVRGSGNAVIIDRCFIMTNFHVVFGRSKDPVTGIIEIDDNPAVGSRVSFAYDRDPDTNALRRRTQGTVVWFGDYARGVGRGMVGDIAILKLDACVESDFVNVVLDTPTDGQRVPAGSLVMLSLQRGPDGGATIRYMPTCLSWPATIVTGVFVANCESIPGISGSMLLSSERADGKWRMAGMVTDGRLFADGSKATYAIYAKALNKAIDCARSTKIAGGSSGDEC